MFDGDQGTDSIGWMPFVAVLHYHLPNGTNTTGRANTRNPSPTVKTDVHSYFKDC